MFGGKIPIFCSGYSYNTGDKCDCFAFENGTWNQAASLNTCRRYATSTLVTLTTGEERMLILGGREGLTALTSVESFDGYLWEDNDFANLPAGESQYCVAKINDTTLISMGGVENFQGRDSYFYNLLTNEWTLGPKLESPRNGLSCGVLNWNNPETGEFEKVVVAASGDYFSTVELLFMNGHDELGSSWVQGPILENEAYMSRIVEFENSVILVGGREGLDGKHLYQLDSPTGSWTLLPHKLKEARSSHVTFFIPDEITNCY